MAMINIEINRKKFSVPEGTTILKACKSNGIYVPTICYHPDLPPSGKCGLCVVKVDGSAFAYSCMTLCQEGMSIETKAPDVIERAKENLNGFIDMSLPPQSKDIETVYNYLYEKVPIRTRDFERTNSVSFSPETCIDCGRCVRMCEDTQHIGALNEPNPRMRNNECISCGQCIQVCPTSALTETKSAAVFLRALSAGKIPILQTAPAVRVGVAECFGDPVGTECSGKIITAARMLGFKYVVDTNFAADMTILEEGTELIERLTKKGSILPMFTSCCPAWINFIEKHHPELIPNITTCKSPHMMLGRVAKLYYSQKLQVDPSRLFVCSLMPCVAKKDEVKRMQLQGDVDCVLTSREFAQLVKDYQIDWSILRPGKFDDPLGEATGGGAIFGVTGGVTEAAIRFAHEAITKQPLGKIVYDQFRGFDAIRTATVSIGTIKLNVAVCNGIGAARDFIESGDYQKFQYIEVMSCPGGCINGGGQPKLPTREMAKLRAKAIFRIDEASPEKVSNHNKALLQFYRMYIGEPGCHKAHILLHTHYEPQETAILAMRKRMSTMPFVGYGSAGGKAMGFARLVASFIGSASLALNNLTIPQLKKRGIAIIVTSTIGDGEYPNNCKKFAEELEKSKEDLSDVKFAVCGIGSTAYRRFCAAGKTIHKLLLDHGAKEITPLVVIDTSHGDHGEAAFEKFATQVCAALGLKAPKIGIKLIFKVTPDNDDSVIDEPYRPKGFDICEMKENTRWTPEGFDPAMHHFTFILPQGMRYETGDHCAILPRNDPSQVDAVIKALDLNPRQVYSVHTQGKIDTLIPSKLSVQELFSQYLDLNGPPDRSLLRAFHHISNKEGAAIIDDLLLPANEDKLTEFTNKYNIGEFICEFVKYGKPEIDLIMSSCPQIKPRLYSIASAPSKARGELELAVANVLFGKGRHGLCTHFLTAMSPKKLAMHTQRGAFLYPKDPKSPIIMTCLGAGIAPMLALMEHREQFKREEMGKAILYFGARNRAGYAELEKIFKDYQDRGIIDEYHIAYSRDGPKKVYITDLMNEDIEKLWPYWEDSRSEFFYCGPPRGIPEALFGIMDKVVEKGKGVSNEEAKEINKKHAFWMEAY